MRARRGECIIASKSISLHIYKDSYKKKQWRPPSKKKKRGKYLSPRNRKGFSSSGFGEYLLTF
jgi:hypothetical protein